MSAAALCESDLTGYMATVHCLTRPVAEWRCGGVPLAGMMMPTQREGKMVPVIRPASVDLSGPAFRAFAAQRNSWALNESYRNPGPLQFGETPLADLCTHTLTAEQGHMTEHINEVERLCDALKMACRPGCTRTYLNMAYTGLKSLTDMLEMHESVTRNNMANSQPHSNFINLPYAALNKLPDQ